VTETARETASGVGETAGQLKEKARDLVSGAADRLEGAWRGTREGVQESAAAMARRAEDFWNDATEFVRRYPVASVAVAFGLGFLVCSALAASYRYSDFGSDDVARRMSRASD
jgi:ElaB/YqjD/DUF883 family membrane-anchored ribosome-binding protein